LVKGPGGPKSQLNRYVFETKKFAPRCLTLSTAQIAAYNALVNLGEDPQRCESVKNFLPRTCVSRISCVQPKILKSLSASGTALCFFVTFLTEPASVFT